MLFSPSPFRVRVSHQAQGHTHLQSLPAARGIQQSASWRSKGRKERCTPLTSQTTTVLRSWIAELGGGPDRPLFPSRRNSPLSRDAVERLTIRYASAATRRCPSLHAKPISPHVFRHSAAMSLLRAGVDTSVIAIWLGHESVRSTDPYLHADMAIKQRALERMTPPGVARGRYRPPDQLLAFLEDL
ncbi:MAG: tyrosine-type recombinase/integrase [Pseudonocardiaceae bacterium]